MYGCVSAAVKSSLNRRQIKTSFETGPITVWRWNQMRVGELVYPPWSVDVGGLCSRNIQINLFKTFRYLTLGTHKQMLAGAPTCLGMCNRLLLCFIYGFKCLNFPLSFLRLCMHARKNVYSASYSTSKVIVILNNVGCVKYSWLWWLTYSQFSLNDDMTCRMETFPEK